MEIPENPRIAIVGGGSWATAIAKILLETNEHINWFMRNIETINAFKELNHTLAIFVRSISICRGFLLRIIWTN